MTRYTLFGVLMLAGAGWLDYRGWGFGNVNQVKNVPKSVRDNPGAYRSHYGYYGRYMGGK